MVGRFLPGGEKTGFSMVKTGLAKIVFAGMLKSISASKTVAHLPLC